MRIVLAVPLSIAAAGFSLPPPPAASGRAIWEAAVSVPADEHGSAS